MRLRGYKSTTSVRQGKCHEHELGEMISNVQIRISNSEAARSLSPKSSIWLC